MDASPAGSPTDPAHGDEARRLVLRLRWEVGFTNAVGAAVVLVAGLLFDPPARQSSGEVAAALTSLLLVVPAVATGIWLSYRLVRPMVSWLDSAPADEAAPENVQRLVLAHPALQAAVLLAVWLLTALGLAIADAVVGDDEPVREFVTTLAGISLAGMVVSTLSFLAAQRVLGPWYPRFFADTDPTRLRVPSTRVRRRLLVAFTLGTAIPLLLVGGVVSERLSDPSGTGQLEAIVWFLVVVGIGSGAWLVLAVRESVTRPLELIRDAAERVSRGDLDVRIPVESPDEFGEVTVAFNAMVEGLRERRRVADLLGRQVGDAVAEKILAEGVRFDVERRTASVLFLDLEGFSELSETLPPEDVVATLNQVFRVVVSEVDARHGLVNKFIGDAVLAVFGAPLDDARHAHHAVGAALAIAAGLEAEGFRFGIGVSTGTVVAGNVGAAQRFEYTVVGDAVNEAARLQELTREVGHALLVSSATVDELGDADSDGLDSLGEFTLKGRSTPTVVYAPSSPV